jgi:hypothetical protein
VSKEAPWRPLSAGAVAAFKSLVGAVAFRHS